MCTHLHWGYPQSKLSGLRTGGELDPSLAFVLTCLTMANKSRSPGSHRKSENF